LGRRDLPGYLTIQYALVDVKSVKVGRTAESLCNARVSNVGRVSETSMPRLLGRPRM